MTYFQQTSNYPDGFEYGVSVLGSPLLNNYPRNVYWVDSSNSSASDGNPGTREFPFKTLSAAIAYVNTVNSSRTSQDIIYIGAGHIDIVSQLTPLNINIGGLKIIGLGNNSDAPTFNFVADAGATFFTISAPNVDIVNVKFVDNIGAGVGVDVTSTAINSRLINCVFSSLVAPTTSLRLGANNSAVIGSYFDILGTNGISLNGTPDSVLIQNNFISLRTSGTVRGIHITSAATNIQIIGNIVRVPTASGIGINLSNASLTGIVEDNCVATGTIGQEIIISSTNTSLLLKNNRGAYKTAEADYTIPNSVSYEVKGGISTGKSFPASTSATVLTINGGPVLIEFLGGVVTTVVQNTANNTKFTYTDTSSSTTADLCATANIQALPVGSTFFVKGDAAATALQIGNSGTSNVAFGVAGGGIVLNPGTIAVSCSATATGAYSLIVRYRPLVHGAYISGV